MSDEEATGSGVPSKAAGSGTLWFIGWLFTVGFAGLSVGKALLAIVVWPYYLGVALR